MHKKDGTVAGRANCGKVIGGCLGCVDVYGFRIASKLLELCVLQVRRNLTIPEPAETAHDNISNSNNDENNNTDATLTTIPKTKEKRNNNNNQNNNNQQTKLTTYCRKNQGNKNKSQTPTTSISTIFTILTRITTTLTVITSSRIMCTRITNISKLQIHADSIHKPYLHTQHHKNHTTGHNTHQSHSHPASGRH